MLRHEISDMPTHLKNLLIEATFSGPCMHIHDDRYSIYLKLSSVLPCLHIELCCTGYLGKLGAVHEFFGTIICAFT